MSDIATKVADAAATKVTELAATAAFKFVSKYGMKLLLPRVDKAPNAAAEEISLALANAPFAVVGLGHCGCHVTAQLAELVYGNHSPQQQPAGLFRRLFVGEDVPQLPLNPVLVLGDVEENTLKNVKALLPENENLLQVSFRPLHSAGVGHVPMFAEFVTNGLLALPTKDESYGELMNWNQAKLFLVHSKVSDLLASKLIFYVFSTGGGTGSGGAAELHRAQRTVLAMHSRRATQMYFTGVSILPTSAEIREDRRMAINTGRAVLQYLANLNISLESTKSYSSAPQCEYALRLCEKRVANQPSDEEESVIRPWDGLAVISNDITFIRTAQQMNREGNLEYANRYIAQQILNLFGSQAVPKTRQEDSGKQVAKKFHQVTRIDPQDLKTFLVGPYAIGFSAADRNEAVDPAWVEKMLVRAIAPPVLSVKADTELIEGISVIPDELSSYQQQVTSLLDPLNSKPPTIPDWRTSGPLQALRDIPMFKTCRCVVTVFTVPSSGEVPNDLDDRISKFTASLLKNRTESRLAVVRGNGSIYTLSLCFQGSVVYSPPIINSLKSYMMLCWKSRDLGQEAFENVFNELVSMDPPIPIERVKEVFGELENYEPEVSDYHAKRKDFEKNWREVVNDLHVTDGEKRDLNHHSVGEMLVTVGQLHSALKFLNYVAGYEKLEQFKDERVMLPSKKKRV